MYHTMQILSSGFAKKVFRKNLGKSVDNADMAVYNEHRQAENGKKNSRPAAAKPPEKIKRS